MALHNAALEQLGHKIKEEVVITLPELLKVKKLLLGLPNVLNKNLNNSIPHVLCAILYP